VALDFDEYCPFDAGPGADAQEDQWRSMWRYQVQNGVLRNVDNELQAYGDSSGMQVKVKTGQVVITGHWGKTTAEDVLPITAAHATLARRDLVVVRADFVNNKIVNDVITGTPASTPVNPQVTRNTSIWEIPVAIVTVAAAASTVSAANVLDARQWGGPVSSAQSDDFLLFGDRVSPCSRGSVNGFASTVNSNTYFIRMQSALDQTVSKVRFFSTTARVAGTAEMKIFYNGYRQDMLNSSIQATDLTNFGSTLSTIDERTLTAPISLRAGEHVVVMMRFASTSTAPVFAGLDVSSGITGANANVLLNNTNTTNMTCGFKTTTMPNTPLNILDGTWTLRDRYFWCALA